MRWLSLVLILILLTNTTLSAQEKPTDWPQFRGPGGMGVSPAKGLPLTWAQKDNIVWKAELVGPGASTPIIVGEKVFITCYSGYNVPGRPRGDMNQLRLHVLCLHRDTGKTIWTKEIMPKLPEQASIRENHGYASSTPVAEGDRLYIFFGKSGVYAFDFDGKQLWQADVGSQLSDWGSAASPVVYGDLLIVNASVESQSLVALDKKTGTEKWRARGIREAWNAPVLVPLKDGKTELVVGVFGKILGFDPASGEQLWSCSNDIGWYIVPSVVAHDGIVWSIGGRSGVAAAAVRAGGRGNVTKTHRLWTSTKGSNVSSPIIHDGHLYWMHDGLGVAYCAEALTGKIVYQERVERAGAFYSAAVLADGRLYYLCRDGRTFVLPASPRYQLLATNDLRDRSMWNSSPAVAGNRLFLRSDLSLYCIGDGRR